MAQQHRTGHHHSECEYPDKDYLYGRFQRGEDWLSRFARKLAYKSQDLADDDVNITQVKAGWDWRQMAVAGAVALAAAWMYVQHSKESAEQPQAQQGASPVDSEYEVRFYDADGNPIRIPHISQRD